MVSNLSVLGSTGSIGTQALEVARELNIKISALAAMKNIELLEKQIREFKPSFACVFNENLARELKIKTSDLNIEIGTGMQGLCKAATISMADTVLISVVGMVGLMPTLEAIRQKKNIALANKETLVAGGKLVMDAVKENNVKLMPVDSEHSAIFQCLEGCHDKKDLKKIILTASGGPFFGQTRDELQNIKPKDALKHPTWNMGAKITIDSATLMNKGLEVIEAKWLFDVDVDNIDVIVHKESIIHSLIEYNDNSVIAQLGVPDMKLPIQYAMTYPRRMVSLNDRLDLAKIKNLTFGKPDENTFVCLKACKEAIKMGGLAPAFVNSANEEAVKLFLDNKITFLNIGELVSSALNFVPNKKIYSINDILEADKNAREYVINTTS